MPAVNSDGTEIYWELQGERGDPVVLVMGLGVDAHGWELQAPVLAARHRVLLVDNRGVGRSGKPSGPYTVGGMARDVVAAMDAAGLARAHVVGISMGGMIAQELALDFPSRVGALVLAATFARPGAEVRATSERGTQDTTGRPNPLALLSSGIDLSTIDVKQAFSFLMPLVLSEKFLREKREWLRQMLERSLSYGFNMAGLVAQIAAVLTHDTAERLPSLRMPTLVVTGTGDLLVPPHHSTELAELIAGARLVLREGATHGLNFEDADWFNQLVLDFLDENPLPGA